MTITVIVPTYRRPEHLARCLNALDRQSKTPDQVLVVIHEDDFATWNLMSKQRCSLSMRKVAVKRKGLVAALNAGLDLTEGEVVAITDDDAAPRPDWLSGIASHFERGPMVGGVGGRDVIHRGDTVATGAKHVVGKVQWFGRVVGNHHVGVGPAREVDILKGVNMSFRLAAIRHLRFDERLRGAGAQVGNDMGMSLRVKSRGWTLTYDPEILVDHYPAERFDDDRRNGFSAEAVSNAVHNETLILLEYLPLLSRVAFGAWWLLVGTRAAPGLVQLMRVLPANPSTSRKRFAATLRGRLDGYRTSKESAAPILRPLDSLHRLEG